MGSDTQAQDPAPVALITGGSSGIGAATARLLLGRGHRVTVTGRDVGRLDRFAAELGRPASLRTCPGDTADFAAVRSAVEATVKEFGRLDAVVASAGVSSFDNLADGDPARWREMILTNVLGPALLVRAALPALRETRGRFVLVGGIAGFSHSAGSLYGVTKWAQTALAENTRLMAARDGVGVTLVAPGRVRTPFWDPVGPFPEGPALTAEEVAGSIVQALDRPGNVDVGTVILRPAE
ncbi:SDR family oxidoreductase [Streptomyces hoynatensis]|uniref:SDR family oxidoreductase n=1 Tax=Streptomyces hoynatensis TaxID=1141874 RepID=UPI001F4D8470|nr:SDR family oxidoreductase [Streptomyces hoynatensis]